MIRADNIQVALDSVAEQINGLKQRMDAEFYDAELESKWMKAFERVMGTKQGTDLSHVKPRDMEMIKKWFRQGMSPAQAFEKYVMS